MDETDGGKAMVRSFMRRGMDLYAICKATGMRAPAVRKMIAEVDAEETRRRDAERRAL